MSLQIVTPNPCKGLGATRMPRQTAHPVPALVPDVVASFCSSYPRPAIRIPSEGIHLAASRPRFPPALYLLDLPQLCLHPSPSSTFFAAVSSCNATVLRGSLTRSAPSRRRSSNQATSTAGCTRHARERTGGRPRDAPHVATQTHNGAKDEDEYTADAAAGPPVEGPYACGEGERGDHPLQDVALLLLRASSSAHARVSGLECCGSPPTGSSGSRRHSGFVLFSTSFQTDRALCSAVASYFYLMKL